jgi:hypothetical protein
MTSGLQDFFDGIYPPELLATAPRNCSVFADRAILTPRNATVADINHQIIRKLDGECKTYLASHTAEDLPRNHGVAAQVSPEVMFSVDVASLTPSRLELKVGAPVILMRNLHPQEGLCNRIRMVIVRLGRDILECEILSGEFAGQKKLIPRIKITSNPGDCEYILTRLQFPVKLCFAMTINKSQGQSFKIIGVDLQDQVFTHGQFYVAMSRVTDVNNIIILRCLDKEGVGEKLLNIVYPEVLIH